MDVVVEEEHPEGDEVVEEDLIMGALASATNVTRPVIFLANVPKEGVVLAPVSSVTSKATFLETVPKGVVDEEEVLERATNAMSKVTSLETVPLAAVVVVQAFASNAMSRDIFQGNARKEVVAAEEDSVVEEVVVEEDSVVEEAVDEEGEDSVEGVVVVIEEVSEDEVVAGVDSTNQPSQLGVMLGRIRRSLLMTKDLYENLTANIDLFLRFPHSLVHN